MIYNLFPSSSIQKTCLALLLSWPVMLMAVNPLDKLGKKLKANSFDFSLYTNQTYFPFKGIGNVFQARYHPGFDIGFTRNIKEKKRSTTYYDVRFGVFNHRHVQTGIPLYGNIGIRLNLPAKFFLAGEFGLGYLHSIKHQTTFKPDGDGGYKKVLNLGRAQLLIGLGLKAGREWSLKNYSGRLFLSYQPWFQMPFIKSYVPMLPNNAVHLGINLNLKK